MNTIFLQKENCSKERRKIELLIIASPNIVDSCNTVISFRIVVSKKFVSNCIYSHGLCITALNIILNKLSVLTKKQNKIVFIRNKLIFKIVIKLTKNKKKRIFSLIKTLTLIQ